MKSRTTGEALVLRSGRSRLNTESRSRCNSVANQGNKQKERKPVLIVQTLDNLWLKQNKKTTKKIKSVTPNINKPTEPRDNNTVK